VRNYAFPKTFAGIALSCSFAIAVQSAFADGAFHWVDSEGRDHYGTNPPKNARSVDNLSGKSFSRYSSSKLLKQYHPPAVSESSMKNSLAPASKATSRSSIALPPIAEEPLLPELSQSDLNVKHDAQKRVTACSVIVKNTAAIPANNVLVSFEFEDGTLVPGAGPESIDAESSGKYTVPASMLPIAISGFGGVGPGPMPKVSIKGGGE